MNNFESVLGLLLDRPKLKETLERVVDYEEEHQFDEHFETLGWEWDDLDPPISPQVLYRLFLRGVLKRPYKSIRHRGYLLANREAVKEALRELDAHANLPPEEETFKVPWDLFDDVVGYEEAKELFLRALDVGQVHFLLVGPPSSAKTLFLLCLTRLPRSRYVLGSRMSKAGLTDYLFTHQPRVLLLDEIDKMHGEDYGVLLSLCQTGRVSEMIYGKTREVTLNTTVFGCANTLKGIPPEVISRFQVLKFKEYGREEFINVVENVLGRRGVESELALYIAKQVWDGLGVRDPREAIRVARLAKTREEVDLTVKWIKKYS